MLRKVLSLLLAILLAGFGCPSQPAGRPAPIDVSLRLGEPVRAGDLVVQPNQVSICDLPVAGVFGEDRIAEGCLTLVVNVTNHSQASFFPSLYVVTAEDDRGRRLDSPLASGEGVLTSGAVLAPGDSADWLLPATPAGEADRYRWTVRVVDDAGVFHTIQVHHRADEITSGR